MPSRRSTASSRASNIARSSSTSKAPNGVLPVPAAATKKPTGTSGTSKSQSKAALPKLRLIVRRLPPGLTETEFKTAVGDEWKLGNGKVDWFAYKEGKISKDPSKPSKPSRAYLKVKEQSYLEALSNKVKQTTFQDAKNTAKDPCLLGPPSLEFAPYGKTPGSRIRHDGRQGTIDQDPEFIDFLQRLTEPVTKTTGNGEDAQESKLDKVTVTPLVQYIKDKKANKAKEAAASKSSKGHGKSESKDTKTEKSESKKISVIKKKAAPTEQAKREKATQDAVKAANKSVTAIAEKGAGAKQAAQATIAKDTTATPAPVKRERERGSISAAARILQRDLGLRPKERKSKEPAAAPAETSTKATKEQDVKEKPPKAVPEEVQKPSTPVIQAPKQPAAVDPPAPPPPPPPSGPKNSKQSTTSNQTSKSSSTSNQKPAKHPPQPSAGAKSAFLKHANPSQGVTEALLEAAFSVFGTLTRCEVDKKKGFGYIDFTDPEGLKKAMAASPVKVGNGQVVVLENKPKPTATKSTPAQANPNPNPSQKRPPRSPLPTNAQPTATTKASSIVADDAESKASATTPPPSAPSGPASTSIPTAPKGASGAARGGRGSQTGSNRGGFGSGGRTGRGGGFRGGRGGFHSNQHRGGGTGGNTSTPSSSTTTATPAPNTTPSTSAAATTNPEGG